MINHQRMTERLFIIRSDEIGIKGKNRPRFERRLAENIARALGLPLSQVKREQGRIYVLGGAEPDAWRQRLEQVFGVKSFSPAACVPATIEAMEAQAVASAQQQVERGARSFKVEARRGVKTFPLTSMEINAHLGNVILRAIPQLSVDVRQPDFKLGVEVRRRGILLSTQTFAGPGGLPVGVNGKALLLLSGGIDSPVAGWMVMKRGLAIDAVYFHSPPYTGEKAREKVFELARVLSRWQAAPVKVYVPNFTNIQVETSRLIPAGFWTLIHRRFMHRIAERIARSDGYDALVTGESVGQVASQTVHNLECIDRAVDVLVLRPLTGFDKLEIVNRAKQIGTYEISVLPYEDCCTLFAPKHPKTSAHPQQVAAAESQLDANRLIAEALERMDVFSIGEPSQP